jgi:hypothetical protein
MKFGKQNHAWAARRHYQSELPEDDSVTTDAPRHIPNHHALVAGQGPRASSLGNLLTLFSDENLMLLSPHLCW